MSVTVKAPKKLIEVALPLDKINEAAAREKSIRHGHPSTLHLWWARRPLAAARAVIFAQMVNDPSWKWEMEHPGEVPPNNLKATWAKSRKRLFGIIEQLVLWENSTNETLLDMARLEIQKSWVETCEINRDHPQSEFLFNPASLPGLHDPFSGGGAIPLEAQRLGLDAYASDLNPVAVLINKAMIEIPPKFGGGSPVNPVSAVEKSLAPREWKGAEGLAEDVRYYGQWMRTEAEKRIGHLYPPVEITAEMVAQRPDLKPLLGQSLTVIAWVWARPVKSPNPAFRQIDVPLASNFILSTKAAKEAYVEPVVEDGGYRFEVKVGIPPLGASDGTKASGRGANFRCIMSQAPISGDYIKEEGKAGRLGARLMAAVAEGVRGRIYLSPTAEMERVAFQVEPDWAPAGDVPARLTGGTCVPYGLKQWGDLFTKRQLVALTTFSDLVAGAREKVKCDAITHGLVDDGLGLDQGGVSATAYADAVSVYLAFALDRMAMTGNSLVRWNAVGQKAQHCFGRQALPMLWDFAEPNFLAKATGSIDSAVFYSFDPLRFINPKNMGSADQIEASAQSVTNNRVVSTDPPYYDNIAYADLSDFFYVWLRPSMKLVFPKLFSTLAVPKSEELVATAHRHGGKEAAEQFFLEGMTKTMTGLATQSHAGFPVTIFYAFKQSESDDVEGTTSTGWETFLEAVMRAGFALTGTWPMRTEMKTRQIAMSSNALASSIVLVCRPRPIDAQKISRRAFMRELNLALPIALDEMTRGSGDESSPVAPVDLSQAIIGPGMAIYSKYASVLEADGSPMTVKTALRLINRFLAEDDFDPDTQFCIQWFEQHGWANGGFGEADQLARSKGTAVNGVQQAGVIFAGGGDVRLVRWGDYPSDWDPATDTRLPIWEVLHHLIRLFKSQGESGAGAALAAVAGKSDAARQLAYRLYTLCERKGWSEDARAYNEIITSWAAIEDAASRAPAPHQATLFDA
jgi:putative DNA methylase